MNKLVSYVILIFSAIVLYIVWNEIGGDDIAANGDDIVDARSSTRELYERSGSSGVVIEETEILSSEAIAQELHRNFNETFNTFLSYGEEYDYSEFIDALKEYIVDQGIDPITLFNQMEANVNLQRRAVPEIIVALQNDEHIESVYEWYSNHEREQIAYISTGEIARKVASIDHEYAVEKGLELSSPSLRGEFMTAVVGELIDKDPKKAMDCYEMLPSASEYETAFLMIINASAPIEPETSMSFALGLESDELRATAFNSVVRTWAKNEPDGLSDWVSRNKMTELQKNIVDSILKNLTTPDNYPTGGRR